MNRPPNQGAGSGPSSAPNNSSAAADREAKMLEAATEGMLTRLADVKASIAGLIAKLENDPFLNWEAFSGRNQHLSFLESSAFLMPCGGGFLVSYPIYLPLYPKYPGIVITKQG